MHLPHLGVADRNNVRARYMFPGQVFNEQESRKRRERKHRDWDGWLELVAEYQKDALVAKSPLDLNRPEV